MSVHTSVTPQGRVIWHDYSATHYAANVYTRCSGQYVLRYLGKIVARDVVAAKSFDIIAAGLVAKEVSAV